MNRGLVFLITILLFVACAQQNQPLTGGPADTTAPVIIKRTPAKIDTNFDGKKIIIKFDEYVKLNNVNSSFFASPPLEKEPKIKLVGKKLVVNLKEELRDSVTYTLNFGNSIVDLNENNELKDFEFVFSTYTTVDSFQISGKIKDAYNFAPIPDAVVMLYGQNIDSLPFWELPIYATKTDTSGGFLLKNVKEGEYKIFALLDMNGNFIYDKDENQIAFSDSLINPYAILRTNYDTIDSGTVVPKMIDDSIHFDTLFADSIHVSQVTDFYPNDLELLLYTEQGETQEIKRKRRVEKGGIQLFFTKKLFNNYLEISPLKAQENEIFTHKIENFPSKDSAFIWFLDKKFYDQDSVKFQISYYANDTLKYKDTLSFSAYQYDTDTLPLFIDRLNQNISVFENFAFEPLNPISRIDTTKIKLFKNIDTLVVDAKEQKITAIRPNYDSLIFAFARPVKQFSLNFDGYQNSNNRYSFNKNIDNTVISCHLKDSSLINIDTIRLTAFYDNLFFFNELVELQNNFALPITYQKAKKVTRPTQDTILIEFNKKVSENFSLKLLKYSNSDFRYSLNNKILSIFLQNSNAISDDSLKFVFETKDLQKLDGTDKTYIDTLDAIFIFDRQKITYQRRYLRSKMILAFKKTLLETPVLNLLSFNPLKKWYAVRTNSTKDTLFIDINNERVKRLNNMKLEVSYFDINQHNDTVYFSDTLDLKIESSETNNEKTIGKEISLNLNKPVDFKIVQDTTFYRRYNILTNYEPEASYSLQIDSAAIFDIFNKTNDTTNFDFRVFAPEKFSNFILELKNIWALLETQNDIDTSSFYELPEGQAILIIEDEKNEIYKTRIFKTDITLQNTKFLPGTYTLKIYYDQNMNKTWDCGNYLKHIQPEKIYIYKEKINLTENSETKTVWDLSEK